MRKYFSIFILLISTFLFSQKTISGSITNSDGEKVASASVTVEEPGSDGIIAYGISNSKGEYKVTFTSSGNMIDLKIKAFNHKTISRQVSNESQKLDFTLTTEATEIKEVTIKTKLITKRGDTISYDLKEFATKNDRTLADVLKNLPGIQVNKNGSILYQGEPLAKFYVNGKDLMEGGYGVINNSLPKDAVQKVEILENHQPVKMLQGKIASDQAAINIKLKKNVTMTGRAEIGAGVADPALWSVKLTPMFFGQKNQWVVNYKTNNIGESVENEGNMFAMGNRWEGIRRSISQNTWLNVQNASLPNVPERRYLYNNVHFISANLLTNPFKNKEWELKTNGSYTNNVVDRESYQETNQFDNKARVTSDIRNIFYTNKAKGEVIFTKNAKKGFFKNVTTFTQFWNADRSNVLQSSVRGGALSAINSTQAIEAPSSSFQNSLSTIVPWKEKMLNLMSFVSYQDDKQSLEVNYRDSNLPGAVSQNFLNSSYLLQKFKMKSFEANHSANISFTKNLWTFTPEIGLNYVKNKMNSSLYGDGNPFDSRYQNDISFSNAVPFGNLRINFKNESWNVFANFPANFNNIKAEDPVRGVSKSLNKVTFEPSAFVQYSFASFWKTSLSGNLNYNFGEIESAFAGAIMKTPGSIGAMDAMNPIPENFSKSGNYRVEYRNPLNNIFFNGNFRMAETTRNLLSTPTIDPLFSITSFIVKDNKSSSNSVSGELGKYFPKFKTNLSFTYSNNRNTSDVAQNGNIGVSKSNSQVFGVKFNNSHFDWLTADFNMSYRWTKQNAFQQNDIKTNGYNHNLNVFVYPLENHTIGFYWDQINSKNELNAYHNAFYDLSYQYSWAKRKIDFEFKLYNIANQKYFENYTLSNFSDSYSRMKIRPRQAMVTVKFNF